MNLLDIRKSGRPGRKKFPVGRGHSSGIGKTCGRGRKGQHARTHETFRAYFEGGQMPTLRRLPKRGFNNKVFKIDREEVNVGRLEYVFVAGDIVDEAALRARGLLRRRAEGVAILGGGTLTKKLTVRADKITAGAQRKIEAAGGTVERIHAAPAPPPASAGAP